MRFANSDIGIRRRGSGLAQAFTLLFSTRPLDLTGVGSHMRTKALVSACAGLVLAMSAACFAEPQLASPADGKAMLERAIAALEANEAAAL